MADNSQVLTYRPLPGARLDMAHPLTQGLVGCWLLNENAGIRAMDLSPYGNHGTLTGFDSPPRRSFNGLAFDGVDDQIIASGPSGVMPNFTVIVWRYALEFDNYGPGFGDVNGWGAFYCHMSASGNMYVGTDVATRFVVGAGIWAINQWEQIVYSINNNAAKVYRNCALVTSGNQTTPATWNAFCTGRYPDPDGDRTAKALISSVSIYNRALSAEEIAYLYAFPYCMFDEPVMPAWMASNNIPKVMNYYRQMRAA